MKQGVFNMRVKKLICLAAACILTLGVLGGCKNIFVKDAKEYLDDIDTTGVAISSKGVVTESIKEQSSDYTEDELKKFVTDEVGNYNSLHGSNSITLDSCEVKEKDVHIVLTYKSYKDYATYHNVPFFYGSIPEAKKAGVALPESINDTSGKQVDFATATKDGTALQLLLFQEPVTVFVDGEVTHVSDNAKADGKNKIVVNKDAAADGQELTAAPVYVIMK